MSESNKNESGNSYEYSDFRKDYIRWINVNTVQVPIDSEGNPVDWNDEMVERVLQRLTDCYELSDVTPEDVFPAMQYVVGIRQPGE